MTSSAGKSGLISLGLPPMCLTASRMVARSTTAGTPVKSCSKTRAGMKAISFCATPGVHVASARMSSARTKRPSSQRKRFSSRMRRENGSFSRLVICCFSSASRRWISKLCAPTLSVSRVPKEFAVDRGIPAVLSLPQAALYDNRNRFRASGSYTGTSMNIVLISTYELGRQPFGLASPAAWLRKRGHYVVCLDLTRQSLDESAIYAADLIALYLPMHTATRLAAQLIPGLRERNPRATLCCYGLYAPMNAEYLRSLGVSTILGGEFEEGLVHLAERIALGERSSVGPQEEPMHSIQRLAFEVPDRTGMPALEKYAHLIMPGKGYRIVGSTEASRGCKHLCRHCPIVPVYKGVFRIVGRDVVLEDIRRQVAAGAQHISFGDPDFFNGIRHAMELVEAFHSEFPALTYDVTIKIEHLRKYEEHLPTLRDTGCLFVISAVESVDDAVLDFLDKGHTREDFLHVVRNFRVLGMTLHPTFVPFSPWTTMDSYIALLEVIQAEGLAENVAPIQLGFRLLIPEGSRLLELEEVRRLVGTFNPQSLAYPWKNSDPRMDAFTETVQEIAAAAERQKESRSATFERIWSLAHAAAGFSAPKINPPARFQAGVPFLSEPWFCCAEPTRDQLVSVGAHKPLVKNAVASADGFV